jgi:hypothetical protein
MVECCCYPGDAAGGAVYYICTALGMCLPPAQPGSYSSDSSRKTDVASLPIGQDFASMHQRHIECHQSLPFWFWATSIG